MGRTPERRKSGRPPAGVGKDGAPEMTSQYPKLSIAIRPSTKAALSAVAALESRPIWLIVEEAFLRYVEAMPADDRRMVEAFVRRAESRQR